MKSRGFSLVELVSVLAVVTSVGAVLGPSVGKMRGQMQGVTSEGNLHMIGQIGAMYSLDHEDRIFSFTWRAGVAYYDVVNDRFRQYPDSQTAAAGQVRDILARATGRLSGPGQILRPGQRLMHRRYSHLVLADYMGGSVTDPMWVDTADVNQLAWQNDEPFDQESYQESGVPYAFGVPDGFDNDLNWTDPTIMQLWPYASSYQVVPHAWQSDFGAQYAPNIFTPHLFSTTGSSPIVLGERRFVDVIFPSAKVHMFEEFDRELAGSPYFAYDHARPAKLMFDGSINTAMSGLAASSVSPRDYLNGEKFVWEQTYVPLDTFPLPLGGLGDLTDLNMRYRWTLGGLTGVDYPQVIMRGSGR
ncbi:MAG: type II secretion system protein [Phycisphaerales bacterium]|nr:type II secretion system protein [Phycisphaerales bacterium]